MKKILIAGDSFSSLQLAGKNGWPKLLTNYYDVTNISQPGIGEYKILQRLKSQDLSKYDLVYIVKQILYTQKIIYIIIQTLFLLTPKANNPN